jgi:7,8-dihydro-6-hydroxymethylpterin dimethyltransferase
MTDLGKRNRPNRPINIYLQFDGFDERTHLDIRGRDLREIKQRALQNCAEVGLTVTLVAAIERGRNEHEVGAIVRYGLAHPAVRSVAFQPVTHSGRHLEFDPLTRLTNPDVIKLLVDQLPEWLQQTDFFPVPCCFPTCRSITYLLTDGTPGEPDFAVVPIPRLINVEDYLDYVTNRVVPDYAIRDALEKLWSASAFMGTATTAEKLAVTTAALACGDACGINLPEAVKSLPDRTFMIVIQDFQDPYTLNVKQLMKCCVEEITPGGRLIPFCAYNSVGYREQVRELMSGVSVAAAVPNALTLQPLLVDSPHGSKTSRNSKRSRLAQGQNNEGSRP